METWQVVIASCAGFVTILTLFEKIGWTSKVKKADADFNQMRKMLNTIDTMNNLQQEFLALQKDQNAALLAILRNELYQSFKINRELEAWTDDECSVQTKLHEAYKALHGNGEESIWWEKKKSWKIVSNEEYKEILNSHYGC